MLVAGLYLHSKVYHFFYTESAIFLVLVKTARVRNKVELNLDFHRVAVLPDKRLCISPSRCASLQMKKFKLYQALSIFESTQIDVP